MKEQEESQVEEKMFVLPESTLNIIFDNLLEQKLKESITTYVTLQKTTIPIDVYLNKMGYTSEAKAKKAID